MIKLMLNTHKFNNYAFFCPVSRLHLTVSSPVGFANEVTPAISRALKAKTILDVDNVINIETGTVKAVKTQEAPKKEEKPVEKAPEKKEPVKVEETVEKAEEVVAPVEETEEKPKKAGKKTTKADAE